MFDGILDISNKFSPFNRVLFDQPKTRRKKKLNHFDVPIETKCAIDVLNIETMDDFMRSIKSYLSRNIFGSEKISEIPWLVIPLLHSSNSVY